MLKRVIWIAVMLAVVLATGCPQSSEVALGGSKASYLIKDKTTIRVSADWQLLKEPFRPAGLTPFENILVQGDVDPSVRYYIAPKAKVLYNGRTLAANTRIKTFRVEYLPIENVGGPPVLLEPIIWEGVIDYDHLDENGDPVITDPDGHPLARTVIAGVVSYYVIRETTQGVVCLVINLAAGIPVCWNTPLFKSDGPELAFDPEDFDAMMEKLADSKTFRGWLEIIPNSHDLAWVRWQITYEAKARNTDMAWQTKAQSGIFVFDWDSDGWRNDYEIETGTDPYDPNDPGEDLVGVPCPPAGVYWDLEKVKEEVSDANLVLDQIIYENSTTVPAGKLIRFKPPCGTQLPVGSEVDAYMSAGPLKVLIPCPPAPPSYWDVEQSENALNDVGLKLGDVNMTFSNTVPKDKLIFFDPPCGTLVEVGSYVDACISKGPQNPQTTTVPNIVGKQLGVAETTLINALLRLGTAAQQYSTRPIGEVLGQSPTPGQVVAVNSAVDVTVSKGPQGPNPLTVTIDSPADNFVGTVGQPINFNSTTTGGVTPYDDHHWHFPDNDHRYTYEDRVKTFDFPGAGWAYKYVTDAVGTVAQDRVWIQINAASKTYRGKIFWMDQWYEYGSWPDEYKELAGF